MTDWAVFLLATTVLAAVVAVDATVGLTAGTGWFFAGVTAGSLLSLAVVLLADRRAGSGWTK